jgi:hypothetical protein
LRSDGGASAPRLGISLGHGFDLDQARAELTVSHVRRKPRRASRQYDSSMSPSADPTLTRPQPNANHSKKA